MRSTKKRKPTDRRETLRLVGAAGVVVWAGCSGDAETDGPAQGGAGAGGRDAGPATGTTTGGGGGAGGSSGTAGGSGSSGTGGSAGAGGASVDGGGGAKGEMDAGVGDAGSMGEASIADAAADRELVDSGAVTCVVRPAQTDGPYFVDERLDRSDFHIDSSV